MTTSQGFSTYPEASVDVTLSAMPDSLLSPIPLPRR